MKSSVAHCVCKILLIQTFSVLVQQTRGLFFSEPINYKYPCCNITDVLLACEPDLYSDKMDQFIIKINKNFATNSVVKLTFDSDIIIDYLGNQALNRKSKILRAGDIMEKRFRGPQHGFNFVLMGIIPGHPNLISLTINDVEFCKKPVKGLFTKCGKEAEFKKEPQDENEVKTVRRNYTKLDFQCGRRRVHNNWVTDSYTGTDLPVDSGSVINGVVDPGEWPWHVGVFSIPIYMFIDNFRILPFIYLCGGTLISRNFVLSAKQCAWSFADSSQNRLDFNFFFVGLGRQDTRSLDDKHNVKVVKIITPNTYFSSFYDIALLKLQSEVQFTDVTRPACLWHRRESYMTNANLVGVLAGWGRTNDKRYSSEFLQQVNLPMVSRDVCIKSFPTFEQFLTKDGFCAGYLNNGTAACYNDIGGALQVFIPDNGTGGTSGTWYVKGIMTKAISKESGDGDICDEDVYAIFAAEEEFADWIDSNLEA